MQFLLKHIPKLTIFGKHNPQTIYNNTNTHQCANAVLLN